MSSMKCAVAKMQPVESVEHGTQTQQTTKRQWVHTHSSLLWKLSTTEVSGFKITSQPIKLSPNSSLMPDKRKYNSLKNNSIKRFTQR